MRAINSERTTGHGASRGCVARGGRGMEGRRGGGQVRSVGGSSLRRGVRTITLSKPLVVRPSHWHRHWHHHRHHHRIYPRVTHTHPRPPSITIYLSLFLSPSPVSLAFHPCVYPNPVPSFTHLHVPPPCPVHTGGCTPAEQSYSFVSSPYARIYEGMQFRG